MLLDHALLNRMPPLIGDDGKTGAQKTHALESVEALAHEKIKTGKITAVQHDLIHLLSEMITTQDHYETICDSLGVPPEYGPMAKPDMRHGCCRQRQLYYSFYVQCKELFVQNG